MRAVSFVAVLCVLCSAACAVTVTGTVKDAAGQPVAGARVFILVISDRRAESFEAPHQEVQTAADGAFSLESPVEPAQVSYFDALAYKPGLAVDFYSGSSIRPLQFVLKPLAPVTGTVLDPNGKPLSGVRVSISSVYERGEEVHKHAQVPQELQDLLAVETDAQGQYTLQAVAGDVRPTIAVRAPGYAEVSYTFNTVVAPIRLQKSGTLQGQLTCADPAVKLEGYSVRTYTDIRGLNPESYGGAQALATTDANGRFTIPEIHPGECSISVMAPAESAHGVRSTTAQVGSGKVTEVALAVEKLAPVKGRVIAEDTGQAIADVRIYAGESSGKTGADGTFNLQCLPGKASLHAYDPARVYLQTDYRTPKTFTVVPEGLDIGDIALKRGRELTVLVVDEAGQPVPGAKIRYQLSSGGDMPPPSLNDRIQTDDQGAHTFKGLSAETAVLSAIKDDLASEVAQVQVDKQQGPLKLVLRPGLIASMTVVLRYEDGQPATDARVELYERSAQYGTTRSAPAPDAEGRVTATALTPGDGYSFKISAPGCWPLDTPDWPAVAGELHDCGVITLARSRGVVAGKVVNAAGEPAAGITVACTLETPKPVTSTTGPDGAFRFEGLMEGPVYLFAYAGGTRCTAQQVQTGQQDLVLRAPATGPLTFGEPITPPPLMPAAEAQKLGRELLIEALDQTKGGGKWERNSLLLSLAKIDPETAFDAAAKGGDSDSWIKAYVALSHLADEPEEARLLLEQIVAQDLFYVIAYGMDQRHLKIAPEQGRIIGELMVECGTLMTGPEALGAKSLGVRWLLKHDPAAGEALLPDLLARAQKLGVADRDGGTRGMVAQVIALRDPDAALALVEPLTESREHYQSELVPSIARCNPQKALELAKSLPEWARDRAVAQALCFFPADQRDLAFAEARKLTTPYQKALALARLSQTHAASPEEARALLVEAVEALTQPQGNSRYGGMNNTREGLVMLAMLTRRAGCQEYRELVWRAIGDLSLASEYPQGPNWEYDYLRLAGPVAAVDPALGRHMLEMAIRRMGDLPKQEEYVLYSLIGAAARCDSQWARQLLEQTGLAAKERDYWSRSMQAIAECLLKPSEEQEDALLEQVGGQSWLVDEMRMR